MDNKENPPKSLPNVFQRVVEAQEKRWAHLTKKTLEPVQLTSENLEEARHTLGHVLSYLERELSEKGKWNGRQTAGYAYLNAVTKEIDRLVSGKKSKAFELPSPIASTQSDHWESQKMQFEALAACEVLTVESTKKKAIIDICKIITDQGASASRNTLNRWELRLKDKGLITEELWWGESDVFRTLLHVYIDGDGEWVLGQEALEVVSGLQKRARGRNIRSIDQGYIHITKAEAAVLSVEPVAGIALEIAAAIISPIAKRISDGNKKKSI